MKRMGIAGFFAAMAAALSKQEGLPENKIINEPPSNYPPPVQIEKLPKGHRYFEINGVRVSALNRRNAERKVSKQ